MKQAMKLSNSFKVFTTTLLVAFSSFTYADTFLKQEVGNSSLNSEVVSASPSIKANKEVDTNLSSANSVSNSLFKSRFELKAGFSTMIIANGLSVEFNHLFAINDYREKDLAFLWGYRLEANYIWTTGLLYEKGESFATLNPQGLARLQLNLDSEKDLYLQGALGYQFIKEADSSISSPSFAGGIGFDYKNTSYNLEFGVTGLKLMFGVNF